MRSFYIFSRLPGIPGVERTRLTFTDPFLEGGRVLLADDDLFIDRQDEFYADLAFFQGFEPFDIIGVDDVFAIGAVEEVLVEFFFEFAEVTFFRHVFPVLFIDEEDQLMFGKEIAGVFDADRLEFHASPDEDPGSFAVIFAEIVGQGDLMTGLMFLMGGEALVMGDGVFVAVDRGFMIACEMILVIDEMIPECLVFPDGVAQSVLANRF